MPQMLRNIDQINASVERISTDVASMNVSVAAITGNLDQVTVGVVDMRHSFQIMDDSVTRMTHDVRHMSKPMQMFNWMNPFR